MFTDHCSFLLHIILIEFEQFDYSLKNQEDGWRWSTKTKKPLNPFPAGEDLCIHVNNNLKNLFVANN